MLSKKQWFYLGIILNPILLIIGHTGFLYLAWWLIIEGCNHFIGTDVVIGPDLLSGCLLFGFLMTAYGMFYTIKGLSKQPDYIRYPNIFPYQKICIRTLASLETLEEVASSVLDVKSKRIKHNLVKLYLRRSLRSKGDLFEINKKTTTMKCAVKSLGY